MSAQKDNNDLVTDEVRKAMLEFADRIERAQERPIPVSVQAAEYIRALVQTTPAQLPESMSRDQMLAYYSQYANLQCNEALRDQKRIRDLEAQLAQATPAPSASPAALTDEQLFALWDEIHSKTHRLPIEANKYRQQVINFAHALLAAQGDDARDAARYRWLRSIGLEQLRVLAHFAGPELDRETDAAMSKEKPDA